MPLRRVERKEVDTHLDGIRRSFNDVQLETRLVNLFYVQISFEHGWPPGHLRASYVIHW